MRSWSATAPASSSGLLGRRIADRRGLGGQVFATGAAARRRRLRHVGRARRRPRRPATSGRSSACRSTSGGTTSSACSASRRGRSDRRSGPREIDALTRFAQLASIALDNARLFDAAQRGALYDPTTGLPNRELLTDRIAHALASATAGRRRADRGGPARPRPVQGHQRERRPRGRRPAAGRRRPAPGRTACGRATPSRASVATSSGSSSTRSSDADEARQIAERIGAELRAPFPLDGRDWFVSASLGHRASGDPGRATPDELLREAEIAMVRAKGDPSSATPCSSRR